jgi:hypothetical protein
MLMQNPTMKSEYVALAGGRGARCPHKIMIAMMPAINARPMLTKTGSSWVTVKRVIGKVNPKQLTAMKPNKRP